MSDAPSKPRIFLSSSSRDKGAADEVQRVLSGAGFVVLPNADLQPGSKWQDAIRDAMHDSDAFVVVTSSENAASPWQALEIGAAMAWGKPIHVVSVDDGLLPAHVQQLRVTRLAELPRLVRSLERETRPLSDAERDVLAKVYAELGVPTDKLMLDPDASATLSEEFGRRARTTASPDRLLRELLRLRKLGKLPRLGRVSRAS